MFSIYEGMFVKLKNRLGMIPGRNINSVMRSAHRDGFLTWKQ
ncbi:hypothetical protein E2C01_096337 [Portunus trituberculatus]|uniref:Uncharacterized protein n=1 Tax=Portunus trituberculatus TaxID=210409 RepID=A0A5B7K1S0_PORTR|nr:hypothetical protein [Portunus trituberculatus]